MHLPTVVEPCFHMPIVTTSDVCAFHEAKHTSIVFALRLAQSDTCVVNMQLSTRGFDLQEVVAAARLARTAARARQ